MIDKFWKYFRWREVTFWTGIVLIISGILRANAIEVPYGVSAVIRPVIDAYIGSNSGMLILAGGGLISVNGKASGE